MRRSTRHRRSLAPLVLVVPTAAAVPLAGCGPDKDAARAELLELVETEAIPWVAGGLTAPAGWRMTATDPVLGSADFCGFTGSLAIELQVDEDRFAAALWDLDRDLRVRAVRERRLLERIGLAPDRPLRIDLALEYDADRPDDPASWSFDEASPFLRRPIAVPEGPVTADEVRSVAAAMGLSRRPPRTERVELGPASRVEHAIEIDRTLAALAVLVRSDDGADVNLVLFDPTNRRRDLDTAADGHPMVGVQDAGPGTWRAIVTNPGGRTVTVQIEEWLRLERSAP